MELRQAPRNYRISIKALIRREDGKLLLNIEHGHQTPSLPGGGIEHGESAREALTRELREEIGSVSSFTMKPICALPLFVEYSQRWLMWIVYEVVLESLDFTLEGTDSDSIDWYAPDEIESSSNAGKLIHQALQYVE